MSPRVLEIGDKGRKHPGRETDPPSAEFSTTEKSTAAQVASFRAGRFRVSVPGAVIIAMVTAAGGFAVAWINKPTAMVALSLEQERKLDQCAALSDKVDRLQAESQQFRNWIEPQIGVILVRLGSQPYAPPPPPSRALP